MAIAPANVPFNVRDHVERTKEKQNWMTTTVQSREGHEKILRYDHKKLVQWTAIATLFCKGTCLTTDCRAFINVFIMLLVGVSICLVMLLSSGEDHEYLKKLDTEPLKDLAWQINALVPFCLALYLSLSLTRWWALRDQGLGKVFDALTSVSMLVSCELHEEKWKIVRNQVAKFGIASVELIVQAARGVEDLDSLVKMDCLSSEEADALQRLPITWERPIICWAWILRICMSAMDYAKTPAPRTAMVMKECLVAKEGMATMNMYLDTQLPFGYVHLMTLLVNVQNMVMTLKAGILFAQAYALGNTNLMVQQCISCLLIVLLYQGILQISYVIADPFGNDIINFPITGYMNYIAAVVDATFEAQAECPVVADNGRLHRPY